MREFGVRIGHLLRGGEIIELVGDVGAGKTTLVKGIAAGLSIDEDIQSPSFTISRVYEARDDLHLAHYDFYRLHDAGIMGDELAEATTDSKNIVIIEWATIVDGLLPKDRLTVHIQSPTESTRSVTIESDGRSSDAIAKELV